MGKALLHVTKINIIGLLPYILHAFSKTKIQALLSVNGTNTVRLA